MKRLILIIVSIFSIVFASQATTFIVNAPGDNGTGTLRQALQDIANVNTNVGGHTIIFSTPMIVNLTSSLDIYNDADFNGLTVNGFVDALAGPDVIIRSNNLCGVRGFNISYALLNAKFYGLVFQNLEYGIYYGANSIGTALNSQIKGCYFGTDITGLIIQDGICKSGINLEQASSVTIGGIGTTLANGTNTSSINSERCIFGGTCNGNTNEVHGAIRTSLGANNFIVNNYIGVSADGNTRLVIGDLVNRWANVKHGIVVDNSKFNTIDGNVISGAVGCGIYVVNFADNTTIKGNKIGTNAAGTLGYNVLLPAASFGNEACGIYLNRVAHCTIGGSNLTDRNLIAGNGGARHVWGSGASSDDCNNKAWDFTNQMGIYGESISDNTILGNYIGTEVTGMLSGEGTNNIMYNRAGGIKIIGGGFGSARNTIGGTGVNDHNVISGHREFWGAKSSQVPGCTAYDLSSFLRGGTGIILQNPTTTANNIIGNYIGLAADGVTGLGNLISGIELQGSANNTIGGTTAGARNYMCDNGWGIMIQEDFQTAHNKSNGNTISGNWIGLNKNGAAVGNGVNASSYANGEGGAIALQMGSFNNTIGTDVVGGGNVISGNRSGIVIRNAEQNATGPANTNTIYNNIIGLDPTGATAIPNTSTTGGYGYGIQIEIGTSGTAIPFGNIIGGIGANQANIISGNQKSGIYINSATAVTASTANSIVGNKIGTNLGGTVDRGNTLQGIEIVNVSKTTITSNLISFNDLNGIALSGSSTNTIQTNTISSNTSNGILLIGGSASNIIGGVVAGEANTINTNGINGILVNGATSINNSIHKNSFSCNTGRGIVLAAGGNASYAAPTIVGTQTQITWAGPAGSTIEVFETDGCATCPSSPTRLQGKTLIATGTSPFIFTTGLGFDKTKTYTATASAGSTTAAHNTSEFSQCYTLCQNPTSVTITGTPLTFCTGGSVTLTANIVGGTGTETYVWKKDGAVVGGNTTTFVASASGSYVVEYSSTTTCSITPSSAVTVTVNPRPTVTSASTGTVCSGIPQNYTIQSSIPSTFSWTRAAVANITPSTGSGSTATITETLTNSTTSAIDVVYLITPTSTTGSCAATSPFAYTVTVNPKATVPNQTPAAICSGTAFTVTPTGVPAGTTYTWAAPVITGSVSGALAQATPQTSISQTLTNNGTTAATVVYTVTPKSGTCDGATFTVTVTVNPRPTVTSASTGTVCSGVPQNYTIQSSVPSTFSWTRAAVANITPSTGSGSTATITETLTNSTTSAIDVVYLITPTSTTGSCAATSPFTYTVTVNPKATVPNQTPAAICSGAAFSVTPTGVPTGTTYTWAAPVITGSVSGALAQATAQTSISQTLTNNGTTAATVVYTVTPKSGTCDGATFTVTVTVNPKPTVTSPGTGAVCSGSPQNYTITSSVASGFSWSRAVVTGISNIAGSGTTNTITETLINTTPSSVDVIYTITPTATTGSCVGDAFTYTVTVNPKPTVTSALAGTICSGDAQNYTITSSVASSFSWSRALVTGISEAASSGTTNTITEVLTNTTPSSIDVIYTITPTTTAGNCPGDAFTYTVTVNPKPTITSAATGAVCSGIAQNYTITSGVVSSFSWTRAAVTGIDNVAGSGSSSTITETLTNSTNAAITVEYIIIPTSTTGSCPGIAFSYVVTVDPKPVATISASGPTAFCLTQSVDLTATATGFTGGTVEWFSGNTSLGNTNPLTVSAAGSYFAVYTSATSCVSAPSASVDITINPDNSPAVIGNDFATCLGTATLVGNIPANGTGTWSTTSTAVVTPSTTPGTAEASNLVDGNTYTFTYTISGACGLDQTASLDITAGLTGLSVVATGPTDTLCVSTQRPLSASASGGSGNYSYIWVSSDGSYSSTGTSANITVQPVAGGETVYTVYVLDNVNIGCKTNDAPVKVHAVEGQDLDIPNLITPNGDHKNDIFYLADKVTGMQIIKEGSHVEVVNRWGSKVYEANNYENNWVPKELTDGMYYYHITTKCGNKEYKSWLQILGNTNN